MIEIENISKNLGEFFLRDISFDIKDGEYFMILGPTGAGKTILLETIAGIYRPDKGRILMAGKDITYVPPKDRNISMVYQDYMLFPHLNVEQNVAFGLRLRKTPKEIIKDKVEKSSKLLNIYHLLHRYPGTLSGGEKQRVAIARAMVIEPYALLLDEPLSALDMQTRDRLRQELKRIHSITKTTIVHVTHNFEEVFSLADRVAVM
ncbi:MAG: ATP-binding cassette domain-containing protein, partial [Deltaproteobacteria bacterium]|nr:ATP-binding cassette domain-containing protein [Deltaproteobacteria bacterium]